MSGTASPIWSKCPWVQIIRSSFLNFFWESGQAGFPLTHGSIRMIRPAYSILKVACPSQVIVGRVVVIRSSRMLDARDMENCSFTDLAPQSAVEKRCDGG